jgi:hypothetical protein
MLYAAIHGLMDFAVGDGVANADEHDNYDLERQR